jgi:hypothetical protein
MHGEFVINPAARDGTFQNHKSEISQKMRTQRFARHRKALITKGHKGTRRSLNNLSFSFGFLRVLGGFPGFSRDLPPLQSAAIGAARARRRPWFFFSRYDRASSR